MAWIESHQELREHPKMNQLRGSMGWSVDEAIGKLHRFWWWCVDYAPNGDLRKYNDSVLGGSVGLNGSDCSKFVEAMVEARWLDREPYFRVHDWWNYIGRFLKIKFKDYPDKWQSVQRLYTEVVTAPVTGPLTPPANRTTNQPTKPNQPTTPTSAGAWASGEFVLLPEATKEQIEEIYQAYPKRVEKPIAFEEIRKALTRTAFSTILAATKGYAAATAQWAESEQKFIPKPADWFSKGRYLDDPAAWQRAGSSPTPQAPKIRILSMPKQSGGTQ